MATSRRRGQGIALGVFSMSVLRALSWDSRPAQTWLIGHLVEAYRLPATAHGSVTAHLALPVVDGLDRTDPDPQARYGSRGAQASIGRPLRFGRDYSSHR